MSGFLQLDDLLRGVSCQGEKVSSGVFSLDIRTAMEKLGKFQMEGFVLDPARISRLPTLLLDSEAGRPEQHLSAGLNAALRTRARSIRLRSGNYQGIETPGSFTSNTKKWSGMSRSGETSGFLARPGAAMKNKICSTTSAPAPHSAWGFRAAFGRGIGSFVRGFGSGRSLSSGSCGDGFLGAPFQPVQALS